MDEERIVDDAVAALCVSDCYGVNGVGGVGVSVEGVGQLVLNDGVVDGSVGGWYYVDGH